MGVPGFDLAVYKDGECVLRYMGGYSDLENKISMTGNERYNIYSCSKPITCVAAMQLWEKGLFSLDDKLSDYMPEFNEMSVRVEGGIKKAERPILIKHLFEMTAGFDYNTGSQSIKKAQAATDGRCPTREVMTYLAKEPLCFEPLGMNHSTFLLPDCEQDTLAIQYRFDAETKKAVNCGKNIQGYKLGTEYASGGAGCISTVDVENGLSIYHAQHMLSSPNQEIRS